MRYTRDLPLIHVDSESITMNPEILELQAALARQEQKIDAIFVSVEKTRRTFQIITWITIATIVLPFIVLMFALPTMISTLTNATSLLSL